MRWLLGTVQSRLHGHTAFMPVMPAPSQAHKQEGISNQPSTVLQSLWSAMCFLLLALQLRTCVTTEPSRHFRTHWKGTEGSGTPRLRWV